MFITRIKLFILLTFTTLNFIVFGQENKNQDTYAIIRVVINEINPEIPIVDTLAITSFKSKFLRDQIESKISLSRKQKRVLKKGDKNAEMFIETKDENFRDYDKYIIVPAFEITIARLKK